MEFTSDEAKKALRVIGMTEDDVDLDQLVKGMNVELEHGARNKDFDVTGNDPVLTAKIALAHLKEMGDYYDRLAEMEKGGGEGVLQESRVAGDWFKMHTMRIKS